MIRQEHAAWITATELVRAVTRQAARHYRPGPPVAAAPAKPVHDRVRSPSPPPAAPPSTTTRNGARRRQPARLRQSAAR